MIAPQHFVATLSEAITTAIDEESNRLAMGAASDWPDYRHRTGLIAGMRNVERIIQKLTEDTK